MAAKISKIRDKQNEKLISKPDSEKALAAARRAMEESRKFGSIKEPEHLASGKSDENGHMVIDDLSPDEDAE